MSSLYEINQDLQAAFELAATDENLSCSDGKWLFDMINMLEMSLEMKLESIGKMVKNEKAYSEMLANEIKALQDRKKVHDNKAESLKSWAAYNIPQGKKYEFATCKYSWRKSERVQIDNPEKIPKEFEKVDISYNLTEIKKAIKAGNIVAGCRIEEKQNIQIV